MNDPNYRSTSEAPDAARGRTFVAIGIVGFVALAILYVRAFGMLPAGDDWQPPLSEIARSRADGPWSLVTHNAWYHPQWRPLQSLAFVALSKLPGNLFAWVSVMNLTCAAVAMTAIVLWSRALGLPPVAAGVAALAFAAHPVNVAAIASNDGFGSVLAPACAWLCCWTLWRLRDRPWLALAAVVPIYVVASGVKEYVFALVPMAGATALLTYRRPVRWMLIVGGTLSAVTASLLAARSLLVPLRRMGGSLASSFSVVATVQNTAMGVGAALAPSNTVALFTTAGTGRVVVLAGGVALTLAIVTVGIVSLLRRNLATSDATIAPARGALLVALLTVGSLFPANASMKISEMYLLGLGIGVALMIGVAARGALAAPRAIRVALALAIVGWLGWASTSTLAKVDETRRTGELSYALGRFLDDTLPREPTLRVAIVYDAAAVERAGRYSVFRIPRSSLVLKESIQWFRPDFGGSLTVFVVGAGDPTPDWGKFDAAIAWDVDRWSGTYLKR